jgi:hypothetical protein
MQHQKPESAEKKTAVTAPTMLVEVVEMGEYPEGHLTVTDNYRVFSDSLSATLYPRNSVENERSSGIRLEHAGASLVHVLDKINYNGEACVATITPDHLLLWKRKDLKPGINDKPFKTMSLSNSLQHPDYPNPLEPSELQSVHLFQDQKTIMGRTLYCPAKSKDGMETSEQVIWFLNVEEGSCYKQYTPGCKWGSPISSLAVLPQNSSGYRFVSFKDGFVNESCVELKNYTFSSNGPAKLSGSPLAKDFKVSQDARYGLLLFSPCPVFKYMSDPTIIDMSGISWPSVLGAHQFQEDSVFLNHQLVYSKKGSNQWCMYNLDTGAVYETELKSDDYCRMTITDKSSSNSRLFVCQNYSMKSIRFVPEILLLLEIKKGAKQLPDPICRLISSYGIFVTPKYPNPGFSRDLTLQLTWYLEDGQINNVCTYTLFNSIRTGLCELKKAGKLSPEEIQKCIDQNKDKVKGLYPAEFSQLQSGIFQLIENMQNEMLAQVKTATHGLG